MTVSAVAERVERRLKPVRERLTPSRETPAERLKGAVETATERFAEATGRDRGSRGPRERVGDYVAEQLESDATRTWSARMALLGAGFLLGFLLGWFARAGRGGDDSEDALPEGLAQPPAGMPRESTLEPRATPSG